MRSFINYLKFIKCQFYIKKMGLKHVDKYFFATRGSHISKDFVAGAYSYVGPGCSICPKVSIGKFTMLANDIQILGGDHMYNKAGIPIILSGRPPLKSTTIGDDVWIGASCIIMAGVRIGDGAIVAAGSVVTKNVDPYFIYGGVPARKIKKRFSDEEVILHAKMLENPWSVLKDPESMLCGNHKDTWL